MKRKMELGVGLAAWLGLGTAFGQIDRVTPDMEREFLGQGRLFDENGSTAKPANQLQARGAVAAFVTADSLYLSELDAACTLAMCNNTCLARTRSRHAFPLPGSGSEPPPMALVHVVRTDRSFRAVVALARQAGRITRWEISVGPQGNQVQASEYNLGAGTPQVLTLTGLRAREYAEDPGFLVFGASGLARRIHEDAAGKMVSESPVVGAGSTRIVASSPGWASASDGRIFEYQQGPNRHALVLSQTRVLGTPAVRVDDYSAMLEDGRYLIRRGGVWTLGDDAPKDFRGVIFRYPGAGTEVVLLGDNRATSRMLPDERSSLVLRNPDGIWARPAAPLYYETTLSKTYEILLRDGDRNSEVLSAQLWHIDFGGEILPDFKPAVPIERCAATGRCVSGGETRMTVTATPQAVTLSMPVLEGKAELDPCSNLHFAGKNVEWTLTERWSQGSMISIAMGKDTVRIRNGHPMGMVPAARKAAAKSPRLAGAWFIGPQGMEVDAAGRSSAVLGSGPRGLRRKE